MLLYSFANDTGGTVSLSVHPTRVNSRLDTGSHSMAQNRVDGATEDHGGFVMVLFGSLEGCCRWKPSLSTLGYL
jgi:hypothetical protein